MRDAAGHALDLTASGDHYLLLDVTVHTVISYGDEGVGLMAEPIPAPSVRIARGGAPAPSAAVRRALPGATVPGPGASHTATR